MAAPEILLQFSLLTPRRGREEAKAFLIGIHDVFADLEFRSTTEVAADGDYVVGRLEGGGTHVGPAFTDVIGFFPAHSGRMMHLAGTIVVRVNRGRIIENTMRMTWAKDLPRFRRVAA